MNTGVKWFTSLCSALFVLAIITGCTSAAGTEESDTGGSGPARLRTTSVYDEWGLRIASPPPGRVNGAIEFELTSQEELKLLLTLRNFKNGGEAYDLASAQQTGAGWKLDVAFPKTGRYELAIYGASVPRGDTRYVQLATLSFDARIDNSQWHGTPAQKRYGLNVVTPPNVTDDGRVEMVVAAEPDTSVSVRIVNAETDELLSSAVGMQDEDGNWHLTARVPDNGVYRMAVYGTKDEARALAGFSMVRARLSDKKTALLAYALDAQDPQAIAEALDAGADPNIPIKGYSQSRDEENESAPPVFFVLRWYGVPDKQIEACRVLQSHGADFTALTTEGKSVIAAFFNNPSKEKQAARRLLSTLIECGADPGQETGYAYIRNGKEVKTSIGVLAKLSGYNDTKKEFLAELIPLLVRNGAGLDAEYPWGKTLIEHMLAHCSPGNKAIVRALLSSGAHPSPAELNACTDWIGSSGFDGDFTFVSDILAATTHINDRDTYGYTALNSLVKKSEMDPAVLRRALSLFVQHGADLRIADRYGYTPLMRAVERVNIPAVEAIMARGIDPNEKSENGKTVMHAISGIRDTDNAVALIDRLTSLGADINARDSEGRTLFYLLCTRSNPDIALLKHLVEKGADPSIPNIDGFTAMGYAHDLGSNAAMQYLTELNVPRYRGGWPVDNDTPACRAVLAEDLSAIRSISAADFGRMTARTPDGVPATPLHLAAEVGSPSLINALSAREVDWNVGDRYGRTPLEKAVLAERPDAVDALIRSGADPTKKNDWGESALSRAADSVSPLFSRLLKAAPHPDWDALCVGMAISAPIDFVKSVSEAHWSDYARDVCATFGRTDILRYLSKTQSAGEKTWEELLARAEKNNDTYLDYNAKSGARLPGAEVDDPLRGKRGTYSLKLAQWSPWMEGDPEIKLADYPVTVFVPEEYDESSEWGLVVSMMNAKSSRQAPSPAYIETLKKHHLIYAGFDPYNGLFENGSSEYFDTNHERFSLAVAYHMFGAYNIDRRRVYLTGFSWGGRLTGEIVPKQPRVFTGGIAVGGCFISGSRVIPSLRYAKAHTAMVLDTGDWDYNRQETANGYNMFMSLGYRAHLFQEPRSGHSRISGENFERAVSLLDNAAGL